MNMDIIKPYEQGEVVEITMPSNENYVVFSAVWDDEHGFVFTTKEVALALGVTESAIRMMKLRHDFRSPHHYLAPANVPARLKPSTGRPPTMWTTGGVIRLCMVSTESRKLIGVRDYFETVLHVDTMAHEANSRQKLRRDITKQPVTDDSPADEHKLEA